MSDLIIKKNGTDYKLPMLAEHYPADRVYLDGDLSKTVQDEIDDVTELKSNKKISSNYVDITSYNASTNQYQFPEDGYVFKGGVTTANQTCLIRYDDLISTRFLTTSVNDAQVDYVRKGMRAYIQANGAGCTILFYPLVSRQ